MSSQQKRYLNAIKASRKVTEASLKDTPLAADLVSPFTRDTKVACTTHTICDWGTCPILEETSNEWINAILVMLQFSKDRQTMCTLIDTSTPRGKLSIARSEQNNAN